MMQDGMSTIRKAFAYIVRDGRLVVFRQPEFPEAGIQVPAGTMHDGEAPDTAVLREAQEETGLAGLEIVRFLGREQFEASATEMHDRWFYALRVTGPVQERWGWQEEHFGPTAIAFELWWMPVEEAERRLIAGHGRFIAGIRQDR